MRASALAESLLRDRASRAERAARPRAVTPNVDGDEFDPFAVTHWRVIVDGEGYQPNTKGRKGPGYLPTTKMRRGPVGWFIECQHCYREFESKGLAYCPACMELPAEERRANRKPQDHLTCVRAPKTLKNFPRFSGLRISRQISSAVIGGVAGSPRTRPVNLGI